MTKSLLSCSTLFLLIFSLAVTALEQPKALNDPQAQLQQLLEQNKGKVIYLDFWASWCIPCRRSFPWMNQIKSDFGAESFTVISVNLDEERQLADEFLLQNTANFAVVFNPTGSIAEQYKILGMPSSFIIDKTGQFRFAHTGFFSNKQDQYELQIKQLLTE
ncbi:TlpA family protein disulfide reductase [Psychrosphaera sp. B3R10]|uniref:TlpA disulfide reductase family protein n=1 Tax=Psychrosphaera algicola TaxID=3023714 RepID=A0ABT5FHI1_9GAMM|nr:MULTISPECIES: TlpA disulfide reductase family protein [unclassified Psychrosphaera]MBU2880484.1 TlpA family protein disulfide reductase [Psychrosphaera sp. I2R16]MBU2991415.1 TlpA family protein disulfide reductase [Psychrosphaera sp. B3R10]MDC2890647.1 TlpA disulfide reductase family protein [Psychrosphaera sp. G1-22]MDO6720296.1 TlpA disulfide reductase family protein [Psychrosphaera sp. 1_MG-2023]